MILSASRDKTVLIWALAGGGEEDALAFEGVMGIEGQVGAPGLENTQDADDHLDGAFDADRHQ